MAAVLDVATGLVAKLKRGAVLPKSGVAMLVFRGSFDLRGLDDALHGWAEAHSYKDRGARADGIDFFERQLSTVGFWISKRTRQPHEFVVQQDVNVGNRFFALVAKQLAEIYQDETYSGVTDLVLVGVVVDNKSIPLLQGVQSVIKNTLALEEHRYRQILETKIPGGAKMLIYTLTQED